MKYTDLTNMTFNSLKVLERAGADNTNKNAVWLCRCECGRLTLVSTSHLKSGHTKSCGCKKGTYIGNIKTRFKTTHGKSRTRLYNTWSGMKQRCYNPKAKKYPLYGGRGIGVCEEWKHSFENFYNWAMENGYKANLTIDRLDNDGNYEPSNCRWATISQQNQNRRICRKDGKQNVDM